MHIETSHFAHLLDLDQHIGHVQQSRRRSNPLVAQQQHVLVRESVLLHLNRACTLLQSNQRIPVPSVQLNELLQLCLLDFDHFDLRVVGDELFAFRVLEG